MVPASSAAAPRERARRLFRPGQAAVQLPLGTEGPETGAHRPEMPVEAARGGQPEGPCLLTPCVKVDLKVLLKRMVHLRNSGQEF